MIAQIKKLSLLAAVALLATVGLSSCEADDAGFSVENAVTPGEIIDPNSKGYLSLSKLSLQVSEERESNSDDESGDYTEQAVALTRSTVEAGDEYIVVITNSKGEQVYKDTYANAKVVDALELPADYYTVRALSHEVIPASGSIPCYASDGGASDTYAVGDEKSVELSNELICKMANVRVAVSVSADMLALFKPKEQIDTEIGDVYLTVKLTYGDAVITFVEDEIGSKEMYFAYNSESSNIYVELTGMYNTAPAGETAVYKSISWTQTINNVISGQARNVMIKIDNYGSGKLLCKFDVESWLEDTALGINVQSAMAVMYQVVEDEIFDPDSMATDLFSPETKVYMGFSEYDTTKTFKFGASIFDYDLAIYNNPIVVYVNPYEDVDDIVAIKSVSLIISTDCTELSDALKQMGCSNGQLSLWSDGVANSALSDYMTIRQESTGVIKVAMLYDGMLMFEQFHGEHTINILAVGENNKKSYTQLNVEVVSESGPLVKWRTGSDGTQYDFETRYHVYTSGDAASLGVTNPEVVIDISSEASSGITGLKVIITGDVLTESALGELYLEQEMDLINPATPEMEQGLRDLKFPVGDEIVGQSELEFNITEFMPQLAILPAENFVKGESVNTEFTLLVTDESGVQKQTIMVYHTQP